MGDGKGSLTSDLMGAASVYLRGDLNLGIASDRWVPDVNSFALHRMNIGIDQRQHTGHIIAKWVSGHTYSAMKYEQTCGLPVNAYASLGIGGRVVKTLVTHEGTQWAANQACCEACQRDPDCDGFVVDVVFRCQHDKSLDCGDPSVAIDRKCYLKNVRQLRSERESQIFGNFKGQHTGIKSLDFHHTHGVAKYALPKNYTPDQLQSLCASMCADIVDCQMWVVSDPCDGDDSAAGPGCWLKN